jgi:hypothetical protein
MFGKMAGCGFASNQPVGRIGAEGAIRRWFGKMAGYGFASNPPYEVNPGYALAVVADTDRPP